MRYRQTLESALKLAKSIVPFELWMITRVNENHWFVLACSENPFGIHDNQLMEWTDSICSKMVEEKPLVFVPDIELTPEHKTAPSVSRHKIKSYASVPLKNAQGDMIGTLCGFDHRALSDGQYKDHQDLPLVAKMIEYILEEHAYIQQLESNTFTDISDELVFVENSTQFDNFESIARQKHEIYAKISCPLGILILENRSKGLAEELVSDRVEKVLYETLRESDSVYRLSEDRLGILLINVDNKFIT
ncbi:GAF domain-containing protein [Glaciecola sp. 1036]|uniref:GAF domain-containing protein n=1 Tax=Alteromonadaceae TaxID=72275 RepID=UPI003CFC764E